MYTVVRTNYFKSLRLKKKKKKKENKKKRKKMGGCSLFNISRVAGILVSNQGKAIGIVQKEERRQIYQSLNLKNIFLTRYEFLYGFYE